MKTKSLKRIIILMCCISLVVAPGFKLSKYGNNSQIVGQWISRDDLNWKLVFTNNNKCYQYYKSTLIETDSWAISNTTPQCGVTVLVNQLTSYLSLTNIADTSDKVCYEIASLDAQNLTIRVVDQGGFQKFRKLP